MAGTEVANPPDLPVRGAPWLRGGPDRAISWLANTPDESRPSGARYQVVPVPNLTWSAVSIAAEDRGPVQVVVHYTLKGITWLIVGTAMLVWLMIGFVFWIPLLIRAAIGFCVEVVNATLTNRSAEAAGNMLRRAVGFYHSGFVVALEAIHGSPAVPQAAFPPIDDDEPEMGIDARGFINELGWTALIWYLIASLLGWTSWTPARVWTEFFGIDWARHFGIIRYSIATWWGNLLP